MPRTPSPSCVNCGKTLTEVGGRRVVAMLSRGLSLTYETKTHPDADPPRQLFAVDDESPALNLVVWGKIWTDELIQRALEELRSGRYPWLCQLCSNHVCHLCGSITGWPVGEVLNDDGETTHVPALPIGRACTNPECDQFNPNLPRRER